MNLTVYSNFKIKCNKYKLYQNYPPKTKNNICANKIFMTNAIGNITEYPINGTLFLLIPIA